MNLTTVLDAVSSYNLHCYATNYLPGVEASFFVEDFQYASNVSMALDFQIMSDASKISSEYYDLLSLISRQAMSALEIAVSKDTEGNFNSSDVMAFLKNMGDVGDGKWVQ